jgi:hypothetical protein
MLRRLRSALAGGTLARHPVGAGKLAGITLALALVGGLVGLSVQSAFPAQAEHATMRADVLFVTRNSFSMGAMYSQLQAQFGAFMQPFRDLSTQGIDADLHLGVIATD